MIGKGKRFLIKSAWTVKSPAHRQWQKHHVKIELLSGYITSPASYRTHPAGKSWIKRCCPTDAFRNSKQKSQKYSPKNFPRPPKPMPTIPASRHGYTARRCGEAGPVLRLKRLRSLLNIRVEQQIPPAATGGRGRRFRTGWRNLPHARPGRIEGG